MRLKLERATVSALRLSESGSSQAWPDRLEDSTGIPLVCGVPWLAMVSDPEPERTPDRIVLNRRDVQVVARYRELRVWASPDWEDASPFDAPWTVAIEGLPIIWGDLGLDAALKGLANRVRLELPELLDGDHPPPRNHLSLLIQLRCAEREGRLDSLLREATRTENWAYDEQTDPGSNAAGNRG